MHLIVALSRCRAVALSRGVMPRSYGQDTHADLVRRAAALRRHSADLHERAQAARARAKDAIDRAAELFRREALENERQALLRKASEALKIAKASTVTHDRFETYRRRAGRGAA
jgi:hypothetical protein